MRSATLPTFNVATQTRQWDDDAGTRHWKAQAVEEETNVTNGAAEEPLEAAVAL